LHFFCSQTCFGRYQGRRVPFSFFVLPDPFWAVPRASSSVFMFCSPGLVSPVPRASGPFFICFAPGPVSGGTEGAESNFHFSRFLARFWRYRVRRVLSSCFALPDSFSAIPRASGTVFMFCAPKLVFDGTESAGSRFHVLRSETHFRRYRVRPLSLLARQCR
jgi:hypothetical protein